jgi:hypothetical protein
MEEIMAEKKYIVIAKVDTEYEDCQVVEEDAMFVGTHRQVFGPDSEAKCKKWKNENCGK